MIYLWQNIKHPDVARIDKAIGEYRVKVSKECPHENFKIKIFLEITGLYVGYTNLRPIDEVGDPFGAVGYGKTEEEALRNTIAEYTRLLLWKSEWKKTDFQYSDSFDF